MSEYKLAKDIKAGDTLTGVNATVKEVIPVAITDGVDEPHAYVVIWTNDEHAVVFQPDDKVFLA